MIKRRQKRYRHVVRAVYETPWAITSEKLEAICELLRARSIGRIFTAAEVAARIGSPRQPTPSASRVAVLNVFGVLCQRMGLMEEISGGCSTESICRGIDAAEADPNVGTIVFNFDTPGGSIFGIPETAARISRISKPTVAMVNSLCASGGYWLASACDEIWMVPSGLVGSIGVLMVHTSTAGQDAQDGIQTTITRAPEGKAEGTAGESLTDAAAAHRQHLVDAAYADFVGDVAKYRGVKDAAVKSDYGRGRVMTARDALDARMIDRIGTLEELLSQLGVNQSGDSANAQEPAFQLEGLT